MLTRKARKRKFELLYELQDDFRVVPDDFDIVINKPRDIPSLKDIRNALRHLEDFKEKCRKTLNPFLLRDLQSTVIEYFDRTNEFKKVICALTQTKAPKSWLIEWCKWYLQDIGKELSLRIFVHLIPTHFSCVIRYLYRLNNFTSFGLGGVAVDFRTLRNENETDVKMEIRIRKYGYGPNFMWHEITKQGSSFQIQGQERSFKRFDNLVLFACEVNGFA
jgi:hypothetical protein